jgi:hypothetical protein
MSDTEAEYRWPTYNPGPPKHIYALGVISLNYNQLEQLLIYICYFSVDPSAIFLFDGMRNGERIAAVKTIASRAEDKEMRAHIECVATYFSICSNNRNILLHCRSESEDNEDIFQLIKNTDEGFKHYPVKLGTLRSVADSMHRGVEYFNAISKILLALNYRKLHPDHPIDVPAWPKIPRPPKSLCPHPPPTTQQGSSGQPQS